MVLSLGGYLSVSRWKKLSRALWRKKVENERSPALEAMARLIYRPDIYNGKKTHVTVATIETMLGSH